MNNQNEWEERQAILVEVYDICGTVIHDCHPGDLFEKLKEIQNLVGEFIDDSFVDYK